MANFRVHHVRFFEHQPKAIHCIAYNKEDERVAVSRSDGNLEIWSVKDNWYIEKTIVGNEQRSIEAVVYCGQRLFSGGLSGDVQEYDLNRLQPKNITPSNAGPIWCLAQNSANTHLAAGTEAGCIVIFDLSGGLVTYDRAFDKQEGRILSLAWHVSGDVIITGGVDNIRVWSTASGHAIQRLTLPRVDKNKETIVWCVAITRDMTIISGDSRGRTSFWNGKQGTLIRSYQSHKADVLCLSVSETENSVVTSGVDPAIVEFQFLASKPSSDWKTWVRSSHLAQHSHDVRAIAHAGQSIVSGGVDTTLICSKVEKGKGLKFWRRLRGLTQKNLVRVAKDADLLVLNYSTYLEVWKLGVSASTSDKSGDMLSLRERPIKLLQLKTKNSESVVCFGVSPDGKWLCYSDQETMRLYRINLDDEVAAKVSVDKIKLSSPLDSTAHQIVFTSTSDKFITAMADGIIHLVNLDGEYPSMQHTFMPPDKYERNVSVGLMNVSPDNKLLAVYYHGHTVEIFNLDDKQHCCSLPKYSQQPTAMTFNLSSDELVLVYTDQKIFEFSVTNEEYTPWCKENLNRFHKQWLNRQAKIAQISFNPLDRQQIVLHDEQMLCVVDKTQPFPRANIALHSRATWHQEQTSAINHAFHICNKYKYLLHVETLKDDWLLVVERPPKTLLDALPQTLRQKKFGT